MIAGCVLLTVGRSDNMVADVLKCMKYLLLVHGNSVGVFLSCQCQNYNSE